MHLSSVRKVFFKTNVEVSDSYGFVAKNSQKQKQERDVCWGKNNIFIFSCRYYNSLINVAVDTKIPHGFKG